ncbi:MAG: guanylate kinase [Candidatus Tectomicrobia bacterium]|uniref:Guanylate kinase n=1 Tax=Tectimicrobiota bacterium TaxID=2528274 RepID=A0A933GLN1_UNCTE|nr:guanylate kinase [Candidatus Tectomicrobia bacterium]
MSIIFIVSAPSGSGKTTLCLEMIKRSSGLMRSISHTTRTPRSDEVDGRDYYFISEEEFLKKITQGEFLEWAKVHGHLYGTSRENLLKARNLGLDLVLVIDVQGASNIQKMNLDGVYIFILVSSLQILETRLMDRGSDSGQEVKVRLQNALEEIEQARRYDYIIINREIEETVDYMLAIVKAERCRAQRFLQSRGGKELLT